MSFENEISRWNLEVIERVDLERKFKQVFDMKKGKVKQSIKKSDTLVWEDSYDTLGTRFDIMSEKGEPRDELVRRELEPITELSH